MEFMCHLEHVNRLWRKDNRIFLEHISLYYALFTWWYYHRKGEQVAISNEKMMHRSGIKSKELYRETLEELDTYGYITYIPSAGEGQPDAVTIRSLEMEEKVKNEDREAILRQLAGEIIHEWIMGTRA
jgi:hypothetical protein